MNRPSAFELLIKLITNSFNLQVCWWRMECMYIFEDYKYGAG